MPWKIGDVDRHKSGLGPKGKRAWLKVANSAQRRCLAGGQDAETCDPQAIKQANAIAGKVQEADSLAREVAYLLDGPAIPLREAGRVLSAKNEKGIRDAVAQLQAILAALGTNDQSAESATAQATEAEDALVARLAEADQLVAAARVLLEAELSHDEVRRALSSAVRATVPLGGYAWPRDVYDSYVVFELENADGIKLYRADYTIGDDGKATLGAAQEVVARTVYEPVGAPATESRSGQVDVTGRLVPLMERAIDKDGTVAVKLIDAGWGSSGYYPAAVLERDGPQVFKAGLHMFADHPSLSEAQDRPERSIRDLAAVLTEDARWDAKGPDGAGLYARAKPFAGFADVLEDIAPHIGVSIRALGLTSEGEAEGQRGSIIESLVSARSADFVTQAGRGGSVMQLAESARARRDVPTTTGGAPAPPPTPTREGAQVNEQEAQALRESLTTTQNELREARTQLARLSEAQLIREARDVVTAQLAPMTMPDPTRARLVEALSVAPPTKDGLLDREALAAKVTQEAGREIAYLQQVAGVGTGRVVGLGESAGTAPKEVTLDEANAELEKQLARLTGSPERGKMAAAAR